MKVLIFVSFLVVGYGVEVTPIEKVIQMLQDMKAQGEKAKVAEKEQWAAYNQWCVDTQTTTKREMDKLQSEISQLTANIQEANADIARLTKEIAGHNYDIRVDKDNMKAAQAVRTMELAEFEAESTDLKESLDALDRAIEVLNKLHNPSGFLQLGEVLKIKRIPEHARRALEAFLQSDQDKEAKLSAVAPEAAVYTPRSGGIHTVLKKLKVKFQEQLDAAVQTEANRLQDFSTTNQMLKTQITNSNADVDSKTKTKTDTEQQRAEDKASRDAKKALHAEKTTLLREVTAKCNQKATDFKSREQLRAEELEAISQAIEIMTSDGVAGSGKKHLPKFAQTSLAQLRSRSTLTVEQKASTYLREAGKKIKSEVLVSMAGRVEADHFKKVRAMIRKLIDRLMEEAADEANHKEFCDTELASNEKVRNTKTEQVQKLNAQKDKLDAEIGALTDEIAQETKSIADDRKELEKATQLRRAEKAKNTQTIKEADEAQVAVAKAIKILKEFYAKAGQATALSQVDPEPEIFDDKYTGMQGDNKGVVGMLEVILTDFKRLDDDTTTAEANAAAEYKELRKTLKANIAESEAAIRTAERRKNNAQNELLETTEDLTAATEELTNAITYYGKLKKSCIDSGVDYEDRVARRKHEICSLQQALKILNGAGEDEIQVCTPPAK